MKTTILAYVIALVGVAMIAFFGLWGLYTLITERVAELRLRDYTAGLAPVARAVGKDIGSYTLIRSA